MDCAFFPYGLKSKEFLIKRCLYLIYYLEQKCDKVIIACNTLSLLVLPLIKDYHTKVIGVFDDLKPYINRSSVIIGSKTTIDLLSLEYNNKLIDGTILINAIQHNDDYNQIISNINSSILGYSNIILACTHFLKLEDVFIIDTVKNL